MPSVLVTGAYSNLGRAIVHTFHENGYVVYGTSTCERKSPEIERTFVMDLSSHEVSFDGIDELDVLVNNAGVFTEAPVGSIGEDDLDTVFDLNVKGLIRVTQALLPAIRRCDGSIVNISSMNAVHPGFGSTSHYDASKGAVSAFTRSLAAQTGLRVNAVQPGLISRDALLRTDRSQGERGAAGAHLKGCPPWKRTRGVLERPQCARRHDGPCRDSRSRVLPGHIDRHLRPVHNHRQRLHSALIFCKSSDDHWRVSLRLPVLDRSATT